MKKNMILKVAAVLTMLTLALVITVLPGTALAANNGVTITTTGGASYNIPVGGSVELNAIPNGTFDVGRINNWSVETGGANVSLSSTSADSTTVTGVNPGTSATVKITVTDGASGTPYTATATINVYAMTMSDSAITLDGGSSKALTIANVPASSTTTWSSSRDSVATVNSSGLITAVGAGTAVIKAYNSTIQERSCTVTVNPIITISPASQNITAANTPGSIQLTVQYGGDLIGSASTISWGYSNPTAGSLSVAPTTFSGSGTLTATATFLSNSTGVNASSTVTATIAGAGSYTVSKTSTVNVRTARYLTLDGNATLNKDNRYGDYTLTLHEANGTVVNDSTSTVHWSWSSSYLSVSNASLNADRAKMINGVAKIQLYGRYNTPSSGTRIYAWINNDSGNKVYTSVVISGLSSLPQTGQDMTLIYVFSGTAAALIAVAGVWYGIRKKRTVA